MDSEGTAWAAGFFDGEGSVNITQNQHSRTGKFYHVLCVDVAQVDPRPLMYLKERWDGCIRTRQPSTANARLSCMWSLRNKAAEDFLRDIHPWVRVKGEQIEIAFAFRETFRARGGSTPLADGVLESRIAMKQKLENDRRLPS